MKTTVLLQKLYKRSANDFVKAFGLCPISPAESRRIFPNYAPAESGIVFAATKPVKFSPDEAACVIGGPCLGDCKEHPTIESVMEVANVISFAKSLRLPALIFLGTGEEQIRDGAKEAWKAVGERYSMIIRRLSELLDYPAITVIDTSDPPAKKIIDEAAEIILKTVTVEMLRGLYDISSDTPLRVLLQSDVRPEIHARFIATYLPSVVSILLGKQEMRVIACENIQQIKAVLKAKALAHLLNKYDGGPEQVIHVPMPNIEGTKRMYRSAPNLKIFLDEPRGQIESKLKSAPQAVLEYFKGVWDRKLDPPKATPASIAAFVERLNSLLAVEVACARR